MKERPILLNGEMVRAILDGRKTQTRRVIKSPAKQMQKDGCEVIRRNPDNDHWYKDRIWSMRMRGGSWGDFTHQRFLQFCPYGVPGDRLWVRENFHYIEQELEYVDVGIGSVPVAELQAEAILYRAEFEDPKELKWKPSIHMPRWASRILLEVTSVRVERAHDISHADAIAEGAKGEVELRKDNLTIPQHWFANLWDSINEKRGLGWNVNPWVWVVEFKVLEGKPATQP